MNEPIITLLPPRPAMPTLVAIALHDFCARYTPPPTLLLYAIYHTILVMAISCEGQIPVGRACESLVGPMWGARSGQRIDSYRPAARRVRKR